MIEESSNLPVIEETGRFVFKFVLLGGQGARVLKKLWLLISRFPMRARRLHGRPRVPLKGTAAANSQGKSGMSCSGAPAARRLVPTTPTRSLARSRAVRPAPAVVAATTSASFACTCPGFARCVASTMGAKMAHAAITRSRWRRLRLLWPGAMLRPRARARARASS
jgi:hypothetical protein